MVDVRPPAVAGSFYPALPSRLAELIDRLLVEAKAFEGPTPKALIVPHAGYVYSGPIAASAYASLRGAKHLRRVVLLGPAHTVALWGLALPGAGAFATPLGEVKVDAAAVAVATAFRQVVVDSHAHAKEHSLEVQLPFLQTVLPAVPVVPLVVGQAEPFAVAEVLDALWGGPETLVVVSTDLSHFLAYDEARRVDRATADQVLALSDAPLGPAQACGAHALNGLLLSARRHGLRCRQLDLRNSADTAGDRARVVGYGAFALDEGAAA
jgi:AmmeMemoRadiSam system protein B